MTFEFEKYRSQVLISLKFLSKTRTMSYRQKNQSLTNI